MLNNLKLLFLWHLKGQGECNAQQQDKEIL